MSSFDFNAILNSVITASIIGLTITILNYYKIKKIEKQKSTQQHQNHKKNTFFESKFKLYNELWSSLIDTKINADSLWESINTKNISNFSKSLNKLKQNVEQKRLLIDEDDYNKIKIIINRFEEYKIRKKKLFNLNTTFSKEELLMLNQIVRDSSQAKEDYEEFIKQIYPKLKASIS